tara:strand:- start:2349 stop:2522 length:174 start_codon:yes stop_codon:yes gene_type:complete
MNYQVSIGLFIVVLVSTYISVRYFGAPPETIALGVAILILCIGIKKVIDLLRKKNDQ